MVVALVAIAVLRVMGKAILLVPGAIDCKKFDTIVESKLSMSNKRFVLFETVGALLYEQKF